MAELRDVRVRSAIALAATVVVGAVVLAMVDAPATAAPPAVCTSTGGSSTVETIGGVKYNVVTFTASGTFTPGQETSVEYLIVAGGGGGGRGNQDLGGGGGGAGGVRINIGSPTTVSTGQAVTVGGGGAGSTAVGERGTSGTDSSAFGSPRPEAVEVAAAETASAPGWPADPAVAAAVAAARRRLAAGQSVRAMPAAPDDRLQPSPAAGAEDRALRARRLGRERVAPAAAA